MPTIPFFYGIYILMYVNDHLPPHFHAEYQGQETKINIRTREIINGALPRQAFQLIKKWRQIHVEELIENWKNANNLVMPTKIAPLD